MIYILHISKIILFVLGTSTLRKNCKSEDLSLCFSLILPDRYGFVVDFAGINTHVYK